MHPRFCSGGGAIATATSASRAASLLSRGPCSRLASASGRRSGALPSRACVVAASSRLVLTPTGDGSCEHIGDKVERPTAIPLQEGVFEVGRTESADIVIRIPTVSSRHALLRVAEDKVSITDLNSTNGTLVNGEELTPLDDVELGVGSEVIFGDVYLAQFRLDKVEDEAGHPGQQQQQQQQQLLQELQKEWREQ